MARAFVRMALVESKSHTFPGPLQTLSLNWQPVIADAEERMIQLRWSIELARAGRELARRLRRMGEAVSKGPPADLPSSYALSIWARWSLSE